MGSGNWWPAVREGELVRYLDEEEYVRLLDDTIPVSAEPGDVIFFKGAPSTSMVIVVSGELEVFEESKGKVHVLGTVPAGSVVGEVGFLDGRPRTRHVRARTACELRRITRDGFVALLTDSPMLLAKMMVALAELLATRYRAVTEELEPVRALTASLREAQGEGLSSLSAEARQVLQGLHGLTPRANGDPEL